MGQTTPLQLTEVVEKLPFTIGESEITISLIVVSNFIDIFVEESFTTENILSLYVRRCPLILAYYMWGSIFLF